MNRSKVKAVQAAGTWKPKDGSELFKYEYHMEDDTVLTAFHKVNAPSVAVGEEAEYLVTKTSQYGQTGKVNKPGQGQSRSGLGGRDWNQVRRQWAVNAAIEFLTSTSIDPSKLELKQVAAHARHMEAMSMDFDAYIEKASSHNNPSDDLPF